MSNVDYQNVTSLIP